MLCSDLVEVRWQEEAGPGGRATANLEDISVEGASLQMENPVQRGATITIAIGKKEWRGCVRYCHYREIGYYVGVEFDGTAWSPEEYEPRHLLDLREFVAAWSNRRSGAFDPNVH